LQISLDSGCCNNFRVDTEKGGRGEVANLLFSPASSPS
jgi:hypothetical protein